MCIINKNCGYVIYVSCFIFCFCIIGFIIIVPSEPQSLEIVSVTSSSLTIQWTPPNVPNGIITYYSIERNKTNIANFSSNELMYTIEGLSPDTVYVLQLRAYTGAGAGLASNVTFITCKLNQESVLDSWLNVLCTNVNSIVNEYIHTYVYIRIAQNFDGAKV